MCLHLGLIIASIICFTFTDGTPSSQSLTARYLVVGAGPAGLQLAHYLESAGRDYLVVDQADEPGSFFARYPRWRQLISINKPATGTSSLDFSLRHDWNSLLSEPSHAAAQAPDERHQLTSSRRVRVPCVPPPVVRDGDDGAVSAAVDDEYDGLVDIGAEGATTSTRSNLTFSSHVCFTSEYSSSDSAHSLPSSASAADGQLFSRYSRDYYPHADELVRYLRDWSGASNHTDSDSASASAPAAHFRRSPLNIRYGVRIKSVARPPGFQPPADAHNSFDDAAAIATGQPRFRLTDTAGNTYECTYLIWAAGLQKQVPPLGYNVGEAIKRGWVRTYSSASTDLSHYHNESVLIVGRGNAAFEFANSILPVAAMVHLIGREHKRIRLAWETHYPGDVRSIHNWLLETYMLKSMDGMAEVGIENLEYGRNPSTGRTWITDAAHPCEVDEYGRDISRCFFRREYDHVIVCAGWMMHRKPFAKGLVPKLHSNGKHPAITPEYESVNVQGLFFAGNLMHAYDFKVSSGGFIHGFRYLIRALHRILEEKEQAATLLANDHHSRLDGSESREAESPTAEVRPAASLSVPGASWPRRPISSLRQAAEALLRRMNHASGPYQMFGHLAEVIVLNRVSFDEVKGFKRAGPLAPAHEPWSFHDPHHTPEYLLQHDPSSAPASKRPSKAQLRSDAAISAARAGAIFEEVPVRLVRRRGGGARSWRWLPVFNLARIRPRIGLSISPSHWNSVAAVVATAVT